MEQTHARTHVYAPGVGVKLVNTRGGVKVYCMLCGALIYLHRGKRETIDRYLAEKLSEHLLECITEPAEGWSWEAERLIRTFLLERLFKPGDRLRISINLLQASTAVNRLETSQETQ
ncbi:MAG: hypothetical protein QXV27_06810 [Candidatus Caldarchaeum sp.]